MKDISVHSFLHTHYVMIVSKDPLSIKERNTLMMTM